MLPLASHIEFSVAAELAIALLLGVGFGACLERAGFASARKLTAVFYFFDMAVVKVMFTAIVTAMFGLFVLSAVGVLDLSDLYLEPTAYRAQLLGGLVFGAGFIIGGYCPGTSVAAMATGKKDGLVFALGMLAGVMAYAELTPGLEARISATSRGELTLPGLTGIGMGWWVILNSAVRSVRIHPTGRPVSANGAPLLPPIWNCSAARQTPREAAPVLVLHDFWPPNFRSTAESRVIAFVAFLLLAARGMDWLQRRFAYLQPE